MLKLFTPKAGREANSKKEKPVSHFIPYKCHWDSNTIITKNNEEGTHTSVNTEFGSFQTKKYGMSVSNKTKAPKVR